MRAYTPSDFTNQGQWARERRQAAEILRLRGTDRKPMPPRDVFCQAASRGFLVTWKMPSVSYDLAGFAVAADTESNVIFSTRDTTARQYRLDSTAGAAPPSRNIFVYAFNYAGVFANPVQTQGVAAAEAAAPVEPAPPPGYAAEGGAGAGTGGTGGGLPGRDTKPRTYL